MLTQRFIYLFKRLLALSIDFVLIALAGFILWVREPLLILPCGWVYYAACSAWLNQRTPGMRAAGLSLHETQPSPYVFSTWRSPLCRTMAWALPLTVLSVGLGYFLFLLIRRDARTLHELCAHTQFQPLSSPDEAFEE